MKNLAAKKGFTLIELLLVIGIIAILAAIVIVAINPTKQLGDARDAQRRSDVNTLLNAIWQYAIDNQGSMPGTAGTVIDGSPRMLGGTATPACGSSTNACLDMSTVDDCLNLDTVLGETYVVSMPVDPGGAGRSFNAGISGYAVQTTAGGRVIVTACDPEQDGGVGITVQR